ncbi:MAG TPA: UDP-N-acetylmuramoyl-tripeptide--D-alanyl-D-alanine ligase, partial [Actinomycetes bacterium]|nr:UDP-N-acetylmuramoyl-tripeptide--D-alanyl-D-alanine ligase [Actinomycetes bacterium]
MIPLTLAEVAEVAAGTLVAADPRAQATGVAVDSRAVRPGDLFFGLAGERADGAAFAADAAAAGAVAAVVPAGRVAGGHDRDAGRLPRVEVGDPLAALAAVAGAVRARARARVVGVTGSSGKTITKDLLAAVLATRLRTLASERSFNNELGLPLTLARLEPETEALVVELGARGVGHVAELCRLARPDAGVVTNVGVAHIGVFGSRDAIARAKAELPRALPPGGVVVLNADDPRVAAMASLTAARVVTYGVRSPADVRAERVALDADGRAGFLLVTPDGTAEAALPVPGEHLVPDALAAAAAGWALGVPVDRAARALAGAALSPMRMQVRRRGDGATVIDDAYNANPDSTAAGLKALAAARRPGGRTIAVLGEMAELGPFADAEHDRVGRLLVRLGVDRLVAVGEPGRVIVRAARQEGIWEPGDAVAVDAVDEVAAAVGPLEPTDVVLVKASRVVGLDRVVERLLEAPDPVTTAPRTAGEDRGGPGGRSAAPRGVGDPWGGP